MLPGGSGSAAGTEKYGGSFRNEGLGRSRPGKVTGHVGGCERRPLWLCPGRWEDLQSARKLPHDKKEVFLNPTRENPRPRLTVIPSGGIELDLAGAQLGSDWSEVLFRQGRSLIPHAVQLPHLLQAC